MIKTNYKKCLITTLAAVFLILGASPMALALDAQDYILGDIPIDPEIYEMYRKPVDMDRIEELPTSYDARDYGLVTPAKDQLSCGSCWAFASVGALESHLLKKCSIGPLDLSEEQQVRCNTAMNGCTSGNSTAPQFWETTGPITEACYPYTATDGSCSYSCTEMDYRVTDFYTVTATTAAFKQSLYDDGPSYWRFDVHADFYTYWDYGSPGSVYRNASYNKKGGHAVLVIGWDDAKGAFLCKNSWGQNAGPNGDGTFWIAYAGHYSYLGFGMSNFDLNGCGAGGCPPSVIWNDYIGGNVLVDIASFGLVGASDVKLCIYSDWSSWPSGHFGIAWKSCYSTGSHWGVLVEGDGYYYTFGYFGSWTGGGDTGYGKNYLGSDWTVIWTASPPDLDADAGADGFNFETGEW